MLCFKHNNGRLYRPFPPWKGMVSGVWHGIPHIWPRLFSGGGGVVPTSASNPGGWLYRQLPDPPLRWYDLQLPGNNSLAQITLSTMTGYLYDWWIVHILGTAPWRVSAPYSQDPDPLLGMVLLHAVILLDWCHMGLFDLAPVPNLGLYLNWSLSIPKRRKEKKTLNEIVNRLP